MTFIPLLLALTFTQAQDKAVFKDSHLGLQFEHPKTWKVRKDKFSAVLEFAVEGGEVATIQLFSAKYKDTADMYQMIQAEINRSMKRKIDRQWQEEFLGVPMLLTKISFEDKGRAMSILTGLLYTAYEEKLNFRLTVAAEGAEKAESAWHDVLLTLRTISGDLPNPEDPNKPAVKPEPPKTTNVWKSTDKVQKPERGPVMADFVAGETKFKLYLPKGWSLEGTTLKRQGLSGTLEMTAAIGLPEEAGTKLVDSARDALAEFDTVTIREDPKPLQSKSGAIVGRVFRNGMAKSHALVAGTAIGSCEAVYWMVTYRAMDANSYKKDKELLNELYDYFFVERA